MSVAAMRVELTDDPTAFAGRDWRQLVEADPSGTFFHTPDYLKVWWEEFGIGTLRLALVRDADRPIGACAFEVVRDELRFLGGFDVTDYLGPVGLPDAADAVSRELLAALCADGSWTHADLRSLPMDSPWLPALESAALALGLGVERGEDGVAPFLSLPGSYEAYLAAIPPKLRHEIRRKNRRLVQDAGPYRFRLSTADSAAADLDRFIALHKQSPGPKGRFMHPGMEIFFRRLGEVFLAPHVFHLAFIDVGGRSAAGAIGLAHKETFSLYNSAFDREYASSSPGMVLVGEMIRGAIEQGRGRFDLLKGDLEYKYRFGSTPRPLGKLVLAR